MADNNYRSPLIADERPRNIVLCRGCLEALESKHRHDFVQCGCENRTFADGGADCQRYGGKDMSLVEVIESPLRVQVGSRDRHNS